MAVYLILRMNTFHVKLHLQTTANVAYSVVAICYVRDVFLLFFSVESSTHEHSLWSKMTDRYVHRLAKRSFSLHWPNNKHNGVLNRQPSDCLLNSFIQDADQRKHQSSAALVFVRGIHRWPVNSPHKGPVTRKMFSFDDVIITTLYFIIWNFERRHLECDKSSQRPIGNLVAMFEYHICSRFSSNGLCYTSMMDCNIAWWRHQMEIFSPLLALREGNPPVIDMYASL